MTSQQPLSRGEFGTLSGLLGAHATERLSHAAVVEDGIALAYAALLPSHFANGTSVEAHEAQES